MSSKIAKRTRFSISSSFSWGHGQVYPIHAWKGVFSKYWLFFCWPYSFFLLKTIFNFIFDEKVISNTWENAMYTYWKTPTSAFGLRLGPMWLETRRRRPSASVWIPSVLRCSAPGVAVGDPWRGFTYKLVFLRGNVCQGVCFTQRAVFTQDFFPSSYGSRDNRKKLKTGTFLTISRPNTR